MSGVTRRLDRRAAEQAALRDAVGAGIAVALWLLPALVRCALQVAEYWRGERWYKYLPNKLCSAQDCGAPIESKMVICYECLYHPENKSFTNAIYCEKHLAERGDAREDGSFRKYWRCRYGGFHKG